MKKYVYLFSILLFVSFENSSQELEASSDAISFAKLMHQKELDYRLDFIKQIKKAENPEKADTKELDTDIYQKIAVPYKKAFTTQELKELHAFYISPVGKKLLENQHNLNSEVSTIAMEWEMQQQGISIEEIAPPIFKDGKLVDANGVVLEEELPVKIEEKPFPKIANLQELKNLLLKEPFMIADQRLLAAIIGEKEMHELFKAQFASPNEKKESTTIEPNK